MGEISRGERYEVLVRDGFACRYCGRRPPEVQLEVDHIEPKSKGGSNARVNLVTACFDCNRGKYNKPAPLNVPLASGVVAIPQWVRELRREDAVDRPCKHESLWHVVSRWKRTEWGEGFEATGECWCCLGPIQLRADSKGPLKDGRCGRCHW